LKPFLLTFFLFLIFSCLTTAQPDIVFSTSGNCSINSNNEGNCSRVFNIKATPVNITGINKFEFLQANQTIIVPISRQNESVAEYWSCGDTNNVSYDCPLMWDSYNTMIVRIWKSGKINYSENITLNKPFFNNTNFTFNYSNFTNQTNESNISNSTNQTNSSFNETNSSNQSINYSFGITFNQSKIFYNGNVTYPNSKVEGSLMTVRVANGIFDDKVNPSFFDDFPLVCGLNSWEFNNATYVFWNASENTQRLVQAIPEYKSYGINAITVNMQGGCSCSRGISGTGQWVDNNPYLKYPNGTLYVDPAYLNRIDSVIQTAKDNEVIVVLGVIYFGQAPRIPSSADKLEATRLIVNHVMEKNFSNVMIETGNEVSGGVYLDMVKLVKNMTANNSFFIPAGYSNGFNQNHSDDYLSVADVVFVHPTYLTWDDANITEFVNDYKNKTAYRGQPIIMTEDDKDSTVKYLLQSADAGLGWGYYNDKEKQSVPANFSVYSDNDKLFFGTVKNLTD